MIDTKTINWLIEDNNQAIKYLTQTKLLGQPADIAPVKSWILAKLPEKWYDTKGLWLVYYITAFAECGLSYCDIPNEHFIKMFEKLENDFNYACGDFMLLTSLMKLGFSEHKVVQEIINKFSSFSLKDGGFLCLNRLNKFKYNPKSCYKVNLHALMFLAECHKKNIKVDFEQPLINYFLNRNIFYKSTGESSLVLNNREGWRTIDTFYPFEVMRVGLQNIIESFCALGYGNDLRLEEAWNILESKVIEGKYILDGTLSKSYLQKEQVGKPSKWITYYALLAKKENDGL